MNIKITPPVIPVLGPFAVVGIIWGIVGLIGLPVLELFVPLSHATRRMVLLSAGLVATFAGSAYSIIYVRRGRSRLSFVDAGMYYFFWPLLFFFIFGFGVFLSRD